MYSEVIEAEICISTMKLLNVKALLSDYRIISDIGRLPPKN